MTLETTIAPALAVTRLRVEFPGKGGSFVAVDDVSFAVEKGTTFGIVGESGSGKSTTVRAILGLVASTGEIAVDGESVFSRGRVLKPVMRRTMQMVFQDPFTSLNPRRRVGDILAESMRIAGERSKTTIQQRISTVIERVGMESDSLRKYPGAFSGGQRQRIGIARALLMSPEILLLDEPTSALDVSVQAQVLNLLRELQRELGLTYLFISHDLAVVRYLCDRVAVMQKGSLVEEGTSEEVFEHPQEEFTRELVASVEER